MKTLFLLFPLILLLAQGAAGNEDKCRLKRGFCLRDYCPTGTHRAGTCAPGLVCCRSIWRRDSENSQAGHGPRFWLLKITS
ncbi:antimicrobial peptide THP1-like [Ammospiza nelsoni]|uniref:antimicrobial peptide THP1-like n=1 Tax=Ammospiza caudacuta TaxID=2857398 RepID=UPI002738C496|nr:antimicrobial peptide THP1-like [Ammospiza caudacuta]XP_059325566.1 antimicrobial peptide THP1-like [Ammospiza nelsoni]